MRILFVLSSFGVLLLIALLLEVILLGNSSSGVRLITVDGNAERVEFDVLAWKLRPCEKLIFVDTGLSDEGKKRMSCLCRSDARLTLCGKEEVLSVLNLEL